MKNVSPFIVLLLQALTISITQAADNLEEPTTNVEESSSSSYLSAQFWGQIIAIIALVVCSGIVAGIMK